MVSIVLDARAGGERKIERFLFHVIELMCAHDNALRIYCLGGSHRCEGNCLLKVARRARAR